MVDGEPLLGVRLEHPPDEILGLLRDAAPLRTRELVLALPDPPFHAGRVGEAVVAVRVIIINTGLTNRVDI